MDYFFNLLGLLHPKSFLHVAHRIKEKHSKRRILFECLRVCKMDTIGLSAQYFASAAAASRQNASASRARHASAKAVDFLSFSCVGLKGSLHDRHLLNTCAENHAFQLYIIPTALSIGNPRK